MADITFRRGTMLTLNCIRKNEAGTPVSVATTTITAPVWRPEATQNIGIRHPTPRFDAAFTVTKTAEVGGFVLSAVTESWPEGELFWRIEFDDAGTVEIHPYDHNLTMLVTDGDA